MQNDPDFATTLSARTYMLCLFGELGRATFSKGSSNYKASSLVRNKLNQI